MASPHRNFGMVTNMEFLRACTLVWSVDKPSVAHKTDYLLDLHNTV